MSCPPTSPRHSVPTDENPALLDTQAVLWMLARDARLSEAARAVIANRLRQIAVSAVSLWEIAIKRSLGKLTAPIDLGRRLAATGQVDLLPVSPRHAEAVGDLPWHHRDPFDRLLVAQALIEGMAIVSSDAELARYGVTVVW
jgi:PIN domain nuclease of toxin-antitoxin system